MPVFTINNNRIVSYEGNEKSVTIPAGITRIGTGAFKGKNVEEIIFEDGASLKSIDDEAFADCKALKSVLIPNGVVQIGDRAFSGCKSLLYIRIPSSVLLVGEDVLFGHSLDLVIIGEKGSEAEAIATKYGITLQGDAQRAIKAIQAAAKGKSNAETRSFEILGETITCSNTLAKYQEAIEYYASRKEPFFALYIAMFPTDLNVRKPDVMTVFESETDLTVDRLAKQGVLTTRDAIRNKYLLEPYTMTVDGLTAIINLQKDASETAISNMSSMQENLAREAESKVTGLSYGIIGDGLDLLAYSIDDFAERQRQRNKAYAEADRKLDQYKRDQLNQCDKLIADAMKQIMPTLRILSDLIIEKLLEAEIDLLTEAGIIEENATKGIDIQKSAQLIQSVVDKRNDNTFTAVLAIKKYPCNVAALTYVYEHNPSCTELKDLIQFLGMSNQVEKGLSDSKKSRFKSYISELKNVSTASQGIDLIQKEIALFSDDEIKEMLICVARAIKPKIEEIALGEKPNVITDTKEYCTLELNKTLTQNDWDFFEKYGISPVESKEIPHESTASHSLLLEWLSSKLSEMMVRMQKYDEYLEKYPLKREEEKTRTQLKNVQDRISFTEKQKLFSFTWILGIILIVIGTVCVIVAIASSSSDGGLGLVLAALLNVGLGIVFVRISKDDNNFSKYKDLTSLRKEEKDLKAKISEIEKLPPFIEDDEKIKEAEAKYDAERLEREFQEEQRRIAAEKASKKFNRIIAITVPIVVACIAFLIVLQAVIIPKQKFNKAMSLWDSGDYDAAYALLEEIGNTDAIASNKYERALALIDSGDYEAAYMLLDGLNYKDSADKLSSIRPQYLKILMSRAEVGSYVYFGSYEQDNDTSNGKEDIEWLVLANEGDRVLLISRYALDYQPYSNYSYSETATITWENCLIRSWLNESFLNTAFSESERAIILSVTVSADKNPEYDTPPGNNTTDKVFLLSIPEVNKYFSSDSARQCGQTEYCFAQAYAKGGYGDGYKFGYDKSVYWGLRTPGSSTWDGSSFSCVDEIGSIWDDFYCIWDAHVRPALWIDIGS